MKYIFRDTPKQAIYTNMAHLYRFQGFLLFVPSLIHNDACYCGLLEYALGPNTSDFSTRGFPQSILGRLRRLTIACWNTDHYHQSSNIGMSISKPYSVTRLYCITMLYNKVILCKKNAMYCIRMLYYITKLCCITRLYCITTLLWTVSTEDSSVVQLVVRWTTDHSLSPEFEYRRGHI